MGKLRADFKELIFVFLPFSSSFLFTLIRSISNKRFIERIEKVEKLWQQL